MIDREMVRERERGARVREIKVRKSGMREKRKIGVESGAGERDEREKGASKEVG